jgi:hypothetical protein
VNARLAVDGLDEQQMEAFEQNRRADYASDDCR